ncbi:MAG: glycosyltransferase [Bacteriovoracaceae bacterium]
MDNNLRLSKNDSVLSLFEEYLSTLDDVESFVNHTRFIGFYLANDPCSKLYSPVIDEKIKQFKNRLPLKHEHSPSGRTLHVATQVYLTGGHTRVIENWINFFNHEKHDLVLIEQYRDFDLKLPKESQVIKLSDDFSISQKISVLYDLYSKYDKVIFHIHQHDVIPLIAMGQFSIKKFFFYNHADHTFSIGPSLVGEVYDMSEEGRLFSLNFRGVKSSKVIPFPLDINLSKMRFNSKEGAREALGISTNSQTVLTVGNPYKFIPNERFNLFNVFERVAKHNPSYNFIFIGPDFAFKKYLNQDLPNIHFLGLVSKQTVLDYYQASDLYIDSLPVGGGLAMIEAVLSGLPIITFDNGFNAFDTALKFRVNYEDLENHITSILDDSNKRTDLQKRCFIEASRHQKEFWLDNFSKLSVAASNSEKLCSERLQKYFEMMITKYPQNKIPRTEFKISNTLIIKLAYYFPISYFIKLVAFQILFPITKPLLSFILDEKVGKK